MELVQEETGFGPRFEEALSFAAHLHRTQFRKATRIPYVAHLLGVASIAIEHGATEDEAIAALLHDAIEDQGGAPTGAAIREKFGNHVLAIVLGCTDADVVPKPPWRERKERYIDHVKSAPPSVKLVSASDKLHNARSILEDYRVIGEKVWTRFKGGKDGSLWYYRALVTAYREGASSPEIARLVDELDRVVTQLEALV